MSTEAIAAAAAVAPRASVPGTYVRYAVLTAAAALLMVAATGWQADWYLPVHEPAFWVLAALCLAGELLPIRLARGVNYDEVTISTAFAFAVLVLYGAPAAIALYVTVSLIVDATARAAWVKALFNASQYAVALVASAAVLLLATGSTAPGYTQHHLPALLIAAAVFFAVNHVLAGAGAAVLTRRPVGRYVRADLGFHVWTAGFQLALAPVVAAAAQDDLVLVPLLIFPVLGIWLGGRQAVVNEHRALHDGLTDLANRELFRRRLTDTLAAAGDSRDEVSVMLIDLDDFKAVNDSLGHHLGDLVLRAAADRLRAEAPEGSTVARLGGDEFAILVPGADEQACAGLASALVARMDQPLEVESFSLDIHGSVGMATFPGGGDDAHSLLKHADIALYRAKETRTGFEAFAGDPGSHEFDRLGFADQLRRGIERGELTLHYQPKLALRGGRTHAVEALVRWQHPYLGLIGPDGFVPLAEQTNLIKPLTAWVLDAALGQCRDWRDRGLDVRVAVNVSTRSLLDPQLPAQMADLLAKWKLPPSSLQVEVTETRIVADFGRARSVLEQLRELGIRVAIDDFGTGYSSLAQLQQLPADEIKIDKSFVRTMETDANDAAIVRSTIGLGRNLELDITAEGVETPETLDELIALGCDYAQGFYLGRPSPAEDCEREIRRYVAARPLREVAA